MREAILCIISIFWFCDTTYYESWNEVRFESDAVSFTLSFAVITAYIIATIVFICIWANKKKRTPIL